jgi:hypothetical protein
MSAIERIMMLTDQVSDFNGQSGMLKYIDCIVESVKVTGFECHGLCGATFSGK